MFTMHTDKNHNEINLLFACILSRPVYLIRPCYHQCGVRTVHRYPNQTFMTVICQCIDRIAREGSTSSAKEWPYIFVNPMFHLLNTCKCVF